MPLVLFLKSAKRLGGKRKELSEVVQLMVHPGAHKPGGAIAHVGLEFRMVTESIEISRTFMVISKMLPS